MSRLVRKFKFSDLKLAYRVRQNMFNALVMFDQNYNQKFEVNEIKKAMVTILREDQMEIQYVVKNIFRYDTNGDNAVTYAQFTNFSVEQHFGEMAIQRLHRKGYYQNGDKRIMTLQQFQTTLNYCLEFISSRGTRSDYQRLFRQVDLDRDGYISYQDYFVFLKEYFGSQSQAFQQEIKNPRPLPPKPQVVKIQAPAVKISNNFQDSPYHSFAKLIYSQFKISVMEKDKNKNLCLQNLEVEDILMNTLRLSYHEKTELKDKILNGIKSINYDEFTKSCLVSYMSDISANKSNKQIINEKDFIQLVTQTCHFVAIKPSQCLLKACFKEKVQGKQNITKNDYKNIMKQIFQNYSFDMRGLSYNRANINRTGLPSRC